MQFVEMTSIVRDYCSIELRRPREYLRIVDALVPAAVLMHR